VPEPARPSSQWVGYLLVAAAATSWGSQGVVAKLLLTGGLPAAGLVSARTAVAGLVLGLVLAVARPGLLRIRSRDFWHVAVLGVVGMALSQWAYYVALSRVPVATALLVTFTSPLLVLAAGVVFYGERVRLPDVMAAAVTLAGAALVVRAYDPALLRLDAAGLAASASCAVTFAFYSLWARRVAPRLSPWTMLAYSLATAAVVWVPLAPPWRVLLAPHPPVVWAGFAVVVIFGTVVPFGLYLAGLARIRAAHASVTSCLEPVVAATVALVVLGERLEGLQLVGGALILAGIALLHARAEPPSAA
jgi:drug/metabolite transporter (DMT)-like permease